MLGILRLSKKLGILVKKYTMVATVLPGVLVSVAEMLIFLKELKELYVETQ